MNKEVKEIADSLGVKNIKCSTDEKTLIRDLRDQARRLGRSDIVQRCTTLLRKKK